MKKTIAILLVLVLAGVGLFAAVSSELTLTTNVAGVMELGIFGTERENKATFSEEGVTASATIDEIAQDEDGDTVDSNETLFLAVRTNKKIAYVSISASALANKDNQYMAYNINLTNDTNTTGATISNLSNPVAATLADSVFTKLITLQSQGLRVYDFPLRFSVTKDQYNVANEGNYTAVITFEVSAS